MIEGQRKEHSFFITMLPLYVLAHFGHHLLTALPVPMLPYIRNEFNLSYTSAAFVTSAFALSYGIGQLPAGWLADRVGTRVLITIGILGVAVAGVLVGISTTYMMLIVFLILMGLMGGGYHPSSAPLISASVEPKQRGRALGIHLIGGSASFFLAPIIAASIAAAWSWRASFIGLAIPSAILGVIFFVVLGKGRATAHATRMAARHPEEAGPAPGNIRRLTAFLVLIVIGGGMGFSITGFIPLYLVDHFGVSEQTAASMQSIIWSAGLWASPLGGYLSDRIGRVPIIIFAGIAGGILIFLLRLVPFGLGIGSFYMDGLGVGILLFFMGAVSFIRMPVAEAYIMAQTSARRRSTIYGVYYFAMQQAGGIFAPVVGALADHYGFVTTFTISSAVLVIVTVACSFFLWEKRR
jgi:MFS family permease